MEEESLARLAVTPLGMITATVWEPDVSNGIQSPCLTHTGDWGLSRVLAHRVSIASPIRGMLAEVTPDTQVS